MNKDRLEQIKYDIGLLINHAEAASPNDRAQTIARTMKRALTAIKILENRLDDKLSARDEVAMRMVPLVPPEWNHRETMNRAFEMADMFLEARKEVSDGQEG